MDNAEDKVARITGDGFADLLGAQLVSREPDRVVVRMPYKESIGGDRVHGGAISALVDIAATAAFWSHPGVGVQARGATVGFTINFLNLARNVDLTAEAVVRRRGGQICTGDVSVSDDTGREVAVARVTYKLSN
jgi:uncharacterized protein (TIGR00369 family)